MEKLIGKTELLFLIISKFPFLSSTNLPISSSKLVILLNGNWLFFRLLATREHAHLSFPTISRGFLCLHQNLLGLCICQLNIFITMFQVNDLTYFINPSLAVFIHASFLVNMPPNPHFHDVREDDVGIIKMNHNCREYMVAFLQLKSYIQNMHYLSLTVRFNYTVWFNISNELKWSSLP